MRGKKVLLISVFDYAGSGYRITEAVSLYTNNFVEYIVMLPTIIGNNFKKYPSMCTFDKTGIVLTEQDVIRINAIAKDVDIIHYKGDFLPSCDTYKNLYLPKKPTIITVSGSFFRIGNNNVCRGKGNFHDYIKQSDKRTAINPDLNYPDFDATYTPLAYDIGEYTWKDSKIPIIAHSPSTRSKKGTDLFLQACEELKDKYKFKINIIEKMTHIDCLEEKSESTIFFDQIGCGSYGNSAVEAMSFGVPTICHISDESYKQSNGRLDNCPIINSGNTLESVKTAIEKALTCDREKLSKETREWCISEHGYENIAKMWDDIYTELLCQ